MSIYSICHLNKNYIISTEGIKTNELKVLHDISLEIKEGEMLGIIGKSGCGKTTLLKTLGGMLKPTSGKIFYQGKDIYQYTNEALADYRRLNVGMIFQDYKLINNISVRENIMIPLILNHDDIEYAISKSEEMARILMVEDKMECYPYELSGGEKQRVAIGRALINNPNVILADEPTGNLDPKTTEDVINLLLKIKKKYNKTVIIVTHDMEIGTYCDRMIKIDQELQPKQIINAIFDSVNYTEKFEQDIVESEKMVVISSPDIRQDKIDRFLLLIKKRQEVGVKVTVITTDPEDITYGKSDVCHELIRAMQLVGINVITRTEVEECFAVIDDEIVWHGGMNLLGKADVWDNLMRIRNSQVATELLEIALGYSEEGRKSE